MTPSKRICASGSSILPDATGDQVYLVKASKLYFVDARGAKTVPVETRNHAGWLFSRLLGIARNTSDFVILAEMMAARGDQASLWLFTVDGAQASGRRLGDDASPDNADQLLDRFVLPRCAQGYESCLIVTNSGALGQAVRGGATTAISLRSASDDKELIVIDGAWSHPGHNEMVILAHDTTCTR